MPPHDGSHPGRPSRAHVDSALSSRGRAVSLKAPEQEAYGEAQHEHGRDARQLPAPGEPEPRRQARIPERLFGKEDLLHPELRGELRLPLSGDGVTVRELHGSVS